VFYLEVDAYFFGLLILAGFFGGFVNTLAGGGSMLMLPALMLLGMPADIANGTNRVGIFLQSAAAVRGFDSAKKLDRAAVLPILVPTLLGAVVGAFLASILPNLYLKPLLLGVMVVMALVMVLKPDAVAAEDIQPRRLKSSPSAWVGLFVTGFYGGFVQAGVGFLLIAVLAGMLRYDLVRTNALKLVCTGALSLVALVIFALADQVLWIPGLILAVGTVAGAVVSVRFAISVSQATLKWILFIMVTVSCAAAAVF
jgi:hypothetical protein